ncbi:MAG: Ppx/GppA phosphatase family protein [Porticoccaceae bacterium]|nr:Ppx/GppA phosphatase family protein [Porticoccaceae bacterium]
MTSTEGSVAVLDMGSNSFHLVVARIEHGEIRTLQTFRESVRLGEGLGESGRLSKTARQRSLVCLKQFGQRLEGLSGENVAAFATNALRVASNGRSFLDEAQAALGYPIQVISGVEEARLIYLGVAHSLPSDPKPRLVVDIGGGSTEFVIGEQFQVRLIESLAMGCVSFMDRFFPCGKLSIHNFEQAYNHASNEIVRVGKRYRKKGWSVCYGSSGSVRAIARACQLYCDQSAITRPALERLKTKILGYSTIREIDVEWLSRARRDNVIAGLAILTAIFDVLKIDKMQYSNGALREGALYDLVGRSEHEDVCLRTVQSMQGRFNVDVAQAERVSICAKQLFGQVADDWGLSNSDMTRLRWAAELHEVGLSISHVQFHKHGEYILNCADMPGFTRQEQQSIAILVRGHRRRLRQQLLDGCSLEGKPSLLRLCVLLRLAVLLNRARGEAPPLDVVLKVRAEDSLSLKLTRDSFDDYPLTFSELLGEAERLHAAGYKLSVLKA